MKKFLLATLLSTLFQMGSYSQQYKPFAIPDTTRWLFANKPLAGKVIDTLFVAKDTDEGLVKLLYHGIYYNQEISLAGFLESSENNSKAWYYSPDKSEKILVFDLDLQSGDEFDFKWTQSIANVDSVYTQNDRKIVQFNLGTDWNEPIKFIEGVGPNISFIRNWYNPGILSPLVVCTYEETELIFENQNPGFVNCGLDPTSTEHQYKEAIDIYPNPCRDVLNINVDFHSEISGLKCSLYNIMGEIILEFKLSDDSSFELNTSRLQPGLYLLKLDHQNFTKPVKIIKK
ncbi:MAG: T9SS type A sorting domain-containing protein [Candidatus Cyclobacteriaceae bacterium M3_2C_046]